MALSLVEAAPRSASSLPKARQSKRPPRTPARWKPRSARRRRRKPHGSGEQAITMAYTYYKNRFLHKVLRLWYHWGERKIASGDFSPPNKFIRHRSDDRQRHCTFPLLGGERKVAAVFLFPMALDKPNRLDRVISTEGRHGGCGANRPSIITAVSNRSSRLITTRKGKSHNGYPLPQRDRRATHRTPVHLSRRPAARPDEGIARRRQVKPLCPDRPRKGRRPASLRVARGRSLGQEPRRTRRAADSARQPCGGQLGGDDDL